MGDLAARYRDVSSRLDLMRARGAYGRRPNRSVLNEIAKDQTVQIFHENVDNTFTIQTIQNVEPIIQSNVEDYNSGRDGYTPSRDLRKVASIPLIEVQKMLQDGINIFNPGDWPKVASKLDDPSWQKFRTAPGKISKRPYREYLSASSSKGK